MTIEWESYPSTLTGKENGDIVVCIQRNPPGETCLFNGYAEVWVDERPLRVRGVQFYADGDSTEELKQLLIGWREKFKAMLEDV